MIQFNKGKPYYFITTKISYNSCTLFGFPLKIQQMFSVLESGKNAKTRYIRTHVVPPQSLAVPNVPQRDYIEKETARNQCDVLQL